MGTPERLALDDETRRALESLGYVWSASPEAAEREALSAIHGKRCGRWGRWPKPTGAISSGDVEGAISGYRGVIEIEPRERRRPRPAGPGVFSPRQRGDEAVELFAEAVAIAPHEPYLHRKLGNTLETLGRYEESLAAYDAGLGRHPEDRDLRDGRWRGLNRLRRLDLLLVETERAIALDPSDGMARYARAIACCGQPDRILHRRAGTRVGRASRRSDPRGGPGPGPRRGRRPQQPPRPAEQRASTIRCSARRRPQHRRCKKTYIDPARHLPDLRAACVGLDESSETKARSPDFEPTSGFTGEKIRPGASVTSGPRSVDRLIRYQQVRGSSPRVGSIRLAVATPPYAPRRADETIVYEVVAEQLETFLAQARDRRGPVPGRAGVLAQDAVMASRTCSRVVPSSGI